MILGVIVYLAPAVSLSAHLDTWRVLIFGIPSALVLYPLAAAGWAPHETRSPSRCLLRKPRSRFPVPYLKSLSTGPGTIYIVAGSSAGSRRYEGPRMGSPRESVILARNNAGHSNSLPAAIILAQGFKRRMLANLIRAGLATAQRENIKAGSLAVGRVRIMRPVDGRSKVDHADRRYVRQEPYERPSGPS